MRTRGARLALAGTLALTGLAGGAVLGPALATAATTEQSAGEAVGKRVDRITQALQGLVDDGTLTEEQRDKVATTLGEQLPRGGPGEGRGHGPGGRGHGPGGRGHGHGPGGKLALDVAASTLGMTEEELRSELQAGKSLAAVAGEKGVPVEDLTAALLKAAEERLAAAVAEGRLTQEEADEKKAGLAEKVAKGIEREGLPGRGRGPRPPAGPPADAPAEDAPSTEGSSYSS